ncbi:E3 ubiquitin-protein ligase APD1 [Henckelia pumila]|uniref:E3 ubiquitin-protein ligase APD1 n=1 Tax=Henckelia pumila TaxID=405737 RepID=UPI003C6E5479
MSTGFKVEDELFLDFSIRLVSNVTAIALFMLIIALIVKLLRKSNGDEEGEDGGIVGANESSRLILSSKEEALFPSYGTSTEEDDRYCLESGKGGLWYSEDLYDGKICVICYDDETNCFFVPCGHSVACLTCANRILKEESKSCPICRGIIHNVTKLRIS